MLGGKYNGRYLSEKGLMGSLESQPGSKYHLGARY